MRCKLLLLPCLITLLAGPVIGQVKIPVLRATTAAVKIRDGKNLKVNYWHLAPTIKPDVYYTDLPLKPHRVTYITDLDSISFDMEYGKRYDFVVMLGKDSCFTSIIAAFPGKIVREKPGSHAASPDTIPFTLKNSRIYLTGIVNGHKNMNIQLDLGAGATCVSHRAATKTGLKFDGETVVVANTSGVNQEPTSRSNTITIGKLKWSQVPLMQVHNMETYEDLIIGNTLFIDKVLEINYDKKILIIHGKLPPVKGFSAHDVTYYQDRPFIQATIKVAGKSYTDWFLFDTGRDGAMLLGNEFVKKHRLWEELQALIPMGKRKVVCIPEVTIAGLTYKNIITNALHPLETETDKQSLLGNKLLNHYNVILDNQNGIMYLQPNGLKNNSYEDWDSFKPKYYGGIAAAVLLILGFLYLMIRLSRKLKR